VVNAASIVANADDAPAAVEISTALTAPVVVVVDDRVLVPAVELAEVVIAPLASLENI
jgi:hypothetical protein